VIKIPKPPKLGGINVAMKYPLQVVPIGVPN